jgi:RNA polymerase sigma-70 factor (ECF subfamily)
MPDGDMLSDEGAAVGKIEREAEGRRIRALTESLPEEQRLAVKLVLLNELSYAEAAEILEVPEGTLTSRLARGRVALTRMIAEGRA